MSKVLILMNVELGWDCILGVYPDTVENRKELTKLCETNDTYVFTGNKIKEFSIRDYE